LKDFWPIYLLLPKLFLNGEMNGSLKFAERLVRSANVAGKSNEMSARGRIFLKFVQGAPVCLSNWRE
jgi:hypothetical protein